MNSVICDMFGIKLPLLALSSSRGVVAEVSKAGGLGVLAASAAGTELLEEELAWLDEHVDGKPYGVDIVAPERFEGKGQALTPAQFVGMLPQEQHEFVRDVLAGHQLDPDDRDAEWLRRASMTFGDTVGEELLEVAFRHPIKLIANALGVPPGYMIDRAKRAGIPVAALVGAKEHAIRQVQAGVDVLIATGYEAGGHTGEVTSMVLTPEIIEAITPVRRVPVLAAGGIVTGRQMAAGLALGADGVWLGSVWLTTEEADTTPAFIKQRLLSASSRDTIRSRARTGKPSRMLRSSWTDAWEADGAPATLPMPQQYILSDPALRRIDQLADQGVEGAQALATYWVGQGVGLMNEALPTREVVRRMAEDCRAAVARLTDIVDTD